MQNPQTSSPGAQSGADTSNRPAAADPGFKLPGDAPAVTPAPAPQREDRGDRTGRIDSATVAGAAGGSASNAGAAPVEQKGANGTLEVAPASRSAAADTSTRDLAIGGTAFLILLVIFFFARNAYVHHLVVRRVAPSSAGNAGWLMFVGFCFISAAAVLAIVNASKFLTFAVTGPLVAVGLIALVATVMVGRR